MIDHHTPAQRMRPLRHRPDWIPLAVVLLVLLPLGLAEAISRAGSVPSVLLDHKVESKYGY